MKKLFSNVGGNQFKLLTENVDPTILKESKETLLLREAIKKMFINGEGTLNYTKLENMGIGFIKNIFEAKKVALEEARILAKEYGYSDNEDKKSFIKEDENDNLDPDQKWTKVPAGSGKEERPSTEEKREVEIGKEMLGIIDEWLTYDLHQSHAAAVKQIRALAEELIQMHQQ